MTRQLELREITATKPSKARAQAQARVEEIVGDGAGFDVKKFAENFDVLAEAAGGVVQLGQLCLQLAFQGRFSGSRRSLVPAVVRGTHEPVGTTRGRDATSVAVAGAVALAVGPADMKIPEGWRWVPLVSVARLESGHTPSRNHADYWDGGIPWIGIRDAKAHNYGWIDSTEQTVSQKGLDNSSARLLPEGTVCLSRTASVGYVTIMKRPMATSQDFVNWVCGEQLYPEFLMQLLRCEVPVLRRFSKGAVHQTIYFPEVKAFHISLPPLTEQKRIVAKVDQLMALCDELETRQTKKRDIGARLTKSALDALTTADGPEEFDAAWKRVVENFDVLIDRAEKVGELRAVILDLSVRGRIVRSAALAPLDAGTPYAIPEDWRWMRLSDLTETITKGSSPKWQGVQYVKSPAEGVLFVTSENVGSGRMLLAHPKYVEARFNEIEPRSILKRGDLLMNIVGASIGRVAVFDRDDLANINQAVSIIRLRAEESVVDRSFTLLFLNSPTCVGFMFDKQVDTARANLSLGNIGRFYVPVPPIATQRAIVAKVDQLMKVCDQLEASLRRAEDRAAKLVEAVVQELVA